MTAGVGVACAEAQTVDCDQLVKRADVAMYRAKQQPGCGPMLDECQPPLRGSPR